MTIPLERLHGSWMNHKMAVDDFNMNIVETSDEHHSSTSSTLTDTTQMYTEMFPGAGCTYGTGQTFMNNSMPTSMCITEHLIYIIPMH